MMQFGIKQKLFLLVLATISAIIAVVVWQIGTQSHKIALDAVNASLAQSKVVLQEKLDSRFEDIEETVVSLTRDGRVLPLVYDAESATLQDLTSEFEKALQFKSMMITDAEGYILARSDRPEAIGYNMAGRSYLFDDPLQGKLAKGFMVSQGKMLQIVAAPVFDNVAKDLVRGVIALSYELSSEIAQDINTLTSSEIAFYIFTYDDKRKVNGVAETYNTNKDFSPFLNQHFKNSAVWSSYVNQKQASSDTSLSLNGEVIRAVISPVARKPGDNMGFILAYRSETELLKPFIDIQKSVFVIGGVCLLIALIIALLIAQRISKPIINLVGLTKDIEEGKYAGQEQVKRSDEIGVLQQALYKMGKSLKEKNELENYLAEMALDIGGDEMLLVESTEPLPAVEKQQETPPAETPSNDDVTLINEDLQKTREQRKAASEKPARSHKTIAGRYELQKCLGRGGAGEVHLALDKELNEQIAVKLLFSEYVSSEFAQMFKEEIRLARKITHRNILRTFDFGKDDDIYYITMEFVPGYDLGKLIDKKGPQSAHIAIIMMRQICSALSAAHELGIIHRDLKPENMMVNRQGILKIMDFGLAMQMQEHQDNASPEGGESRQTTVAGTPKYMAPEQFMAGHLDQRTDIYAVGIIFFTLLTGRTPFNKKDIRELGLQHIQEEPPKPSEIIQNVPAELEAIIERCLEKDPEDRYQSVSDLLSDLNEAEV